MENKMEHVRSEAKNSRSANIRKLAKDHKGYGSAATSIAVMR